MIESRGVGGYCVVYSNNINLLTYLDIKEISDKDKEKLEKAKAKPKTESESEDEEISFTFFN